MCPYSNAAIIITNDVACVPANSVAEFMSESPDTPHHARRINSLAYAKAAHRRHFDVAHMRYAIENDHPVKLREIYVDRKLIRQN